MIHVNVIEVCDSVAVVDDFEKERLMFLGYLRAKGRKETTVRTYSEALKSLRGTMRTMGLNMDMRTLTADDIIMIKDALTVSETSKKLYMIVLGRFLEVLTESNLVKEADILWNQCEKRRLFIGPQDFKDMMATCNEKERVVMMLGAYMGLRRCEMCSMRLEDIRGNTVRVRGKGHGEGKMVDVLIPRPVMSAVNAWLDARGVQSEYLLCTKNGTRLDTGTIGRIVARVAKRCGVSMTVHSLRRLYATTLYDVGTDLDTIRRLMRHNSIETLVECYLNANPVKKEVAIESLCQVLA